ncbi:hypothetical protein [Sphingobacterium sp. SGR-19]|uniref:HU family DNA-binding protein n=1 Tax=Sphingobacterium sp. SGR-19 TaxID=2710886 RepID=UPI0013EDE439|nr:hypothetical protein [Sphingobacterium sp. SGR-19]NGM65196.1 hypothetical protein [Sphingobacterium sp. SGR-19]
MAIKFNIQEIPCNIFGGYIIRLGSLGSFHLGSGSVSSETADEVTDANIHRRRVLFQNGGRSRNVMTDLTFKKIE